MAAHHEGEEASTAVRAAAAATRAVRREHVRAELRRGGRVGRAGEPVTVVLRTVRRAVAGAAEIVIVFAWHLVTRSSNATALVISTSTKWEVF